MLSTFRRKDWDFCRSKNSEDQHIASRGGTYAAPNEVSAEHGAREYAAGDGSLQQLEALLDRRIRERRQQFPFHSRGVGDARSHSRFHDVAV
jgi:hypothetical protein